MEPRTYYSFSKILTQPFQQPSPTAKAKSPEDSDLSNLKSNQMHNKLYTHSKITTSMVVKLELKFPNVHNPDVKHLDAMLGSLPEEADQDHTKEEEVAPLTLTRAAPEEDDDIG